MRRIVTLALLSAVLASGCSGDKRNRPENKVLRAITATEHLARSFTYTDATNALVAKVTGRVEDDLRFESTLSIGGVDIVQDVVYDDALAVRFLDTTRVPPIGGPEQTALLEGRWAVDYQAAPPLEPTRNARGNIEVGQQPVLDAAYVFQYVRRAIAAGIQVITFNPDSLTYFPKEDPFPKPEKGGPVTRYDVIPQPLPRRAQRGTQESQPGVANFRKLSVYVRAGKVERIEEEISIRKQHDFLLAAEGKGSKYNKTLLEATLEGRTREPIRERRMTLLLTDVGSTITLELPPDAVPGDFGSSFGPRGLRGRNQDTEPAPDTSPVPTTEASPVPAS